MPETIALSVCTDCLMLIANGETRFVIQDRCQPDRATLGCSLREWDAWVRAGRQRYWT